MRPGVTVTVDLTAAGVDPAVASIKALGSAFERFPEIGSAALSRILPGGALQTVLDSGDLFVAEVRGETVCGADEACLWLVPGDLYLRLVATVQREAGLACVFDHGWPILSVGESISAPVFCQQLIRHHANVIGKGDERGEIEIECHVLGTPTVYKSDLDEPRAVIVRANAEIDVPFGKDGDRIHGVPSLSHGPASVSDRVRRASANKGGSA